MMLKIFPLEHDAYGMVQIGRLGARGFESSMMPKESE